MGKRKRLEALTRRKPKIQLDYYSDEEDFYNEETLNSPNASSPNKLDNELNSFLKEIESMNENNEGVSISESMPTDNVIEKTDKPCVAPNKLPLPENWIEVYDPNYQTMYYYNKDTLESKWEHPSLGLSLMINSTSLLQAPPPPPPPNESDTFDVQKEEVESREPVLALDKSLVSKLRNKVQQNKRKPTVNSDQQIDDDLDEQLERPVDISAELKIIIDCFTDKFEFLKMSVEGVSDIFLLYLRFTTRLIDYNSNALDPHYFLKILKQMKDDIDKMEETMAPKGWKICWDNNQKRYCYQNTTTNVTQYSYPEEEGLPTQISEKMYPSVSSNKSIYNIHSPVDSNENADSPSNMPSDNNESDKNIEFEQENRLPALGTVETVVQYPLINTTSVQQQSIRDREEKIEETIPKTLLHKKRKKEKTVFKQRHMAGLVNKWQQVRDEIGSDSEDEKYLTPDEWRQQQLESGASKYNPNFEDIGDWRSKLAARLGKTTPNAKLSNFIRACELLGTLNPQMAK